MTPKPPRSLVQYLRERRCVLFCGSGLSAWAKLPTWPALLRSIVDELETELQDDPNLADLRRLIEAGKLLEVADHCKEALGRRYYDILSERLRGDEEPIPEPHQAIVQAPFAAIVTTNYDKLLERSFAAIGSLPKTPTHSDVDALGPLLFDGSFFILKAHGDIDRPDGMVLTTRDYQEIIHANPAFNSLFSAILLTKAVLFVGYSLNDPDFRLLLDRQMTIFKGNVPERFALMSGVGKVERDVLWRTARIRVLSYDDGKHEQVLEFLRALLAEVRNVPQAPAAAPQPRSRGIGAEDRPAPRLVNVMPVQPEAARSTSGATLSIRLVGRALHVSLSGAGATVQDSGSEPNWSTLRRLMHPALQSVSMAKVIGVELATCLPTSVVAALTSLPADETITLDLSAQVELLPWEMAYVGDQFLSLRNPTIRSPVTVSNAARGYPTVRVPPRVLLIGDPDPGRDGLLHALPGAAAEVREIAALYRGNREIRCDLLLGADASFDAVAAALASGTYDVVHFAGHAWFEDDLEPFMMLSNGAKLRSGELRSLLSPGPPAILFLNSHFTAFTPPGLSGEENKRAADDSAKLSPGGQRSFIDAALSAGVGVLIGTFTGALDDRIAQAVGVRVHKELLDGQPVAGALHRAMQGAPSGDLEANPSHLAYAMSGYGNIVLRR
jgi:hypothetical protein